MPWSLAIVAHPNPGLVGSIISLADTTDIGRDHLIAGVPVFDDNELSRRHARLEVVGNRLEITDLGSRNGTFVGEARVERAVLSDGSVVRIGPVVMVAGVDLEATRAPELVGISAPHHRLLGRIAELGSLDTTVSIIGEPGTGKRLVAEALHRASGRDGELVTIYCGSIPDPALASELFGHRAGAFDGASADRVGLLEAADRGTVLLDGLDRASAQLQTQLAELLDHRAVRRLGDTEQRALDVRVLAAAQRPLEALVRDGRLSQSFADRLGKIAVEVPPLRERRADIVAISDSIR